MPGSVPSMAVQKKQSVTPPSQGPLSTRTVETQKKGNGSNRPAEKGNHITPNSQKNKTVCSSSVNKSAQINNTASPRTTAGSNGPNIDERLRLARERREENEKLLASRELSRVEREQRATRYYEQQLQERKKKFLEQRMKEERRRAAVEEKRKQTLKEEKERHESAVRKTLEKSQRAQQNLSQNSRGRKLSKTGIPRRLPLTTWEKNLVSRLLTPTCSYLARSKSAGCQSGEEVVHVCRRSASCHSMNTTKTTTSTHKPQHPSGPVHHRTSASPSPNNSQHRSPNPAQIKAGRLQTVDKKISNTGSKTGSNTGSNIRSNTGSNTGSNIRSNTGSNIRPPIANTRVKPAANTPSRTPSPSPERTPRRSIRRHSTPLQLELPSVPEEDLPQDLPPGNSTPIRSSAEGRQEEMEEETLPDTPQSSCPDTQQTEATTRTEPDRRSSQMPLPTAPQPPEVMSRPSAGTTNPEEASRLLAEKRREARLQREREAHLQREREEQERLQREDTERRSREELEHRRAEDRARQQAETQRLVEEKRRRDEEEQRQAEEERAQAMKEAALLQKQREEEQAKEREKAEQLKQEREILVQKEEAERQARKKRLEEIMRRTRRTDSADMKSVPVRILPKENTEPVQNGTIGEAVKLPVGTKPSQLGLNNVEDMVPVVAFKERRSLRTLTGLEEIQTHQRAEVI